MERVLGGVLAALALTFFVTSTASAVEIPPTPECVAKVKAGMKDSFKEYSGKTKKEKAELDRQFAEDLAAAGCVSDAKPLYVNMPARPFTEQCAEAAADAQVYFDSAANRLKAVGKPFAKVERPFRRQWKSLTRRIKRLESQDRPRQAASLKRERRHLKQAFQAKVRKYMKKTGPLIADFAYKSILIVSEFMSIRCIPLKTDYEFKIGGPAERVFRKNAVPIFGAMLYLFFKLGGEDAFAGASMLPVGLVPEPAGG